MESPESLRSKCNIFFHLHRNELGCSQRGPKVAELGLRSEYVWLNCVYKFKLNILNCIYLIQERQQFIFGWQANAQRQVVVITGWQSMHAAFGRSIFLVDLNKVTQISAHVSADVAMNTKHDVV